MDRAIGTALARCLALAGAGAVMLVAPPQARAAQEPAAPVAAPAAPGLDDTASLAAFVDGVMKAHLENLRDSHGLSGWWAQMITVGYERLRGLRAVGQRRGGAYEAHKSVTVAAPVEVPRRAVHDARQRAKWLKGVKIEIRTATAPRSMRIRLAHGIKMDAYFTAKGPAKSALALQLSGFPDKEAAQAAKQFWGERLEALKRLVAAE